MWPQNSSSDFRKSCLQWSPQKWYVMPLWFVAGRYLSRQYASGIQDRYETRLNWNLPTEIIRYWSSGFWAYELRSTETNQFNLKRLKKFDELKIWPLQAAFMIRAAILILDPNTLSFSITMLPKWSPACIERNWCSLGVKVFNDLAVCGRSFASAVITTGRHLLH